MTISAKEYRANVERQLEEYADSLGLFNPLTLERLIELHNTLREKSLADNEERRTRFQAGWCKGYEMGLHRAKINTITFAELRRMDLATIAELIRED